MLVAEFGRSGLSARRFAQLCGVHYNTFWNWLQEHGLTARHGKKHTEPKPRLVEVRMESKDASGQLPQTTVRISLPGGAEASLRHAGEVPLLAALLKALA